MHKMPKLCENMAMSPFWKINLCSSQIFAIRFSMVCVMGHHMVENMNPLYMEMEVRNTLTK